MRDHRPQSASDLLAKNHLSSIQKQAKEIVQLNSKVKLLLPKGSENFVRVANIRHGMLMLEAASAAIKMKLDYERLHLLSQLRAQGFPRLVGIEITINPEIYKTQDEKRKDETGKRSISPLAAEMLTMVATHAPEKIRKRLENIAQLAQKDTQ